MASTVVAKSWEGRHDQDILSAVLRWHHQVILPDSKLSARADYSGLLGFCCDAGVERNNGRIGAAQGPEALRNQLKNLAWHNGDQQIIDFGDVKVSDSDMEAGQALLALQVGAALTKVSRLLVVGGGHETAYASFCGLRRALPTGSKIGIINLDAHFDLRCPDDRGPSSGTPFYQIQELVGADSFHYFCLGVAKESNTEALFKRANQWSVQYYTDTELNQLPPPQINNVLQKFCHNCDALYLTIDMDVLPHYQAPGVSAPASRGVSLQLIETLISIVSACAENCRYGLPLVEISELNPNYDQQQVTARTAAILAAQLLQKNNFDPIVK